MITEQAQCRESEIHLPDLITIPGIIQSGELPAAQNGNLAGALNDPDEYHRDVPDTHYYYG